MAPGKVAFYTNSTNTQAPQGRRSRHFSRQHRESYSFMASVARTQRAEDGLLAVAPATPARRRSGRRSNGGVPGAASVCWISTS